MHTVADVTNASQADETIVGRVAQLLVYPLKSAMGIVRDQVGLSATGLDGDRRWALTLDGQTVGAKQVPLLESLRVESRDGSLWVYEDGQARPARPETLARLLDLTGREVGLVEDDAGHAQVASVHLVSRDAPGLPGCSAEPRANLVLDLVTPGAERDWLGHSVWIGQSELTVTRLPKRCLGIYAEVPRPGRLRVGDVVRVSIGSSTEAAASG